MFTINKTLEPDFIVDGVAVSSVPDLDCTLEFDMDKDLIAVIVDHIHIRIERDDKCPNAKAIWSCAKRLIDHDPRVRQEIEDCWARLNLSSADTYDAMKSELSPRFL